MLKLGPGEHTMTLRWDETGQNKEHNTGTLALIGGTLSEVKGAAKAAKVPEPQIWEFLGYENVHSVDIPEDEGRITLLYSRTP